MVAAEPFNAAKKSLDWLAYGLFFAFGLLTLLPIFWMISTSLKPLSEALSWPVTWLPFPPKWENFPDAINHFPFVRYSLNSIIVAVSHTVLTVILSCFAGYSLA